MAAPVALELHVGPDGTLVVSAEEMEKAGVHPGDLVRIEALPTRRVRSMLGYGARDLGFTSEHLRELRSEMGDSLGEDQTA